MRIIFQKYPSVLGFQFVKGCNAKCIWCPIGSKLAKHYGIMSRATFDAILPNTTPDEIADVWLSENGEAILHPQFKEFAFKIRHYYTKAAIGFDSNFYGMTPDLSKFLLDLGVHFVSVNIDGWSAEGYKAVKGLDRDQVMKNFLYFLDERNRRKHHCGIHVNVLTQPQYYTQTNQTEKITVKDETLEVFHELMGIIEWGTKDSINYPFALRWRDRNTLKIPRKKKVCISMPNFGKKAFIDYRGNLYPCCLDYDSEYTFGNLTEEHIHVIWNGEKRKQFLEYALSEQWEKIGQPCVWCQD